MNTILHILQGRLPNYTHNSITTVRHQLLHCFLYSTPPNLLLPLHSIDIPFRLPDVRSRISLTTLRTTFRYRNSIVQSPPPHNSIINDLCTPPSSLTPPIPIVNDTASCSSTFEPPLHHNQSALRLPSSTPQTNHSIETNLTQDATTLITHNTPHPYAHHDKRLMYYSTILPKNPKTPKPQNPKTISERG